MSFLSTIGKALPFIGLGAAGGAAASGKLGSLSPGSTSAFDPKQKKLYGQYYDAIQGEGGPLADIFGYNPDQIRDLYTKQYAEPAYQQFQEEIVPSITGAYRGRNLQNSSYLGGALSKAGTNVQKGIDSNLANMLYQAEQNSLNRKQSGVNQLLGMQTFAYNQSPIMSLLQSLAGGAGKAAGSYLGGGFLMPQVQFLDIPNIGSAIGKFGGSFLDEYTGQLKRQKEEDAIADLFGGLDESLTPEQKQEKIFSAKNVPFEQKQVLAKSIGEITKQAKAAKDLELKQQQAEIMKEKLNKAGVPDWLSDLYSGATEGGRTAIMKQILDENPELFQKIDRAANTNFSPSEEESVLPGIDKDSSLPGEEPKKQETLKDFDAGLTRKEKVSRGENRYKVQTPLAQENNKQLDALDGEIIDLERLEALNENMSEENVGWLKKLNIKQYGDNAGEIIFPAAATEEQAEWQKILYNFQKRAKDSYGARVTNFDISNFMKRFPTLAHNPEARRQILQQMKIVDEIDRVYKKELDSVVGKYGIRNIDWDVAQRQAKKNVEKQKSQLVKQFVSGNKVLKNSEDKLIQKAKSKVPEGKVLIQNPDGQFKGVSPDKAKLYKKQKGYTIYD